MGDGGKTLGEGGLMSKFTLHIRQTKGFAYEVSILEMVGIGVFF